MRYILLVMLLGISIVTNAQMGYWCDSTWIELTPIGESTSIFATYANETTYNFTGGLKMWTNVKPN